ncbi:MAG TPA: hypothetical protein VF981_14625 [Gemmatimonadaceae bacterium]
MTYRSLDSRQILQTLDRLTQRIDERFPSAGLSAVSRELVALGRFCAAEADTLGKPNWPIRTTAGALILAVVALSIMLLARPWADGTPLAFDNVGDYLQAIEAAVNELVFLAVAIWFLGSIERRLKRHRALAAIHQLRSIAHVVDMHQLTKDPDQLLSEQPGTSSSPTRTMTRAMLGRYLDYCSELLSLTSKIAALFVQQLDDPVVLAAVDEVSSLTNGLSQKIWQKLTILERN